jgi:lysophospholipase L1-like esterase
MDAQQPPPKDALLFIGSSSIRMWDLGKSFPDLGAINRGFGGSHTEDSTFYTHRIVWPYRPRTIVLYAGDNDIAFGKTPQVVVGHFNAFVARVREKLPDVRIVYIPIKPSIARWNLWPKMNEANMAIKAVIDKDAKLAYADCATPMLGDDGKPREELFVKDGLHLSEKGYEVWTQVVKPIVEAE